METSKELFGMEEQPAVKRLAFLDQLTAIGEEPYEIEFEVKQTAEACAKEFAIWIGRKGIFIPEALVEPFLSSLFIFLYLMNWRRGIKIARLNHPLLLDFFSPYAGPEFRPARHFLSPFELLALFLRFLKDSGYDLNLERLLRAINRAERETRDAIEEVPREARVSN